MVNRRKVKISNKEWAARQLHRELEKSFLDETTWDDTPRPPMLWGYIRCSHQDSMDSGLGLEAQRRLIIGWANFLRVQHPELPEITWVEEGKAVSAYKVLLTRRPGGKILNCSLREGDHVIFAYLDRTWRNAEDCLATLRKWDKRGIVVHFANVHVVTNEPTGKLLITVLAAFAESESAMKSERIKEVLSGLKAFGRVANGHAPLGFKLIGRRGKRRAVASDPEARRIMGEIVRFYNVYKCSWTEVSDYVKEWTGTDPAAQLLNPQYPRPWTPGKCKRAYYAELELQNAARKKQKEKDNE